MVLKIHNKDDFISRFLNPVSKINNSCILKLTNTGISTLLSAADNTAILLGQYDADIDTDDTVLNLPDVSRLIKIIQCIADDDIALDINQNHIQYNSEDVRFKYHLLEDGILMSPSISVDKIKSIDYSTTLSLPYQSIINLIKSSSFTMDINKVYISTNENSVYAEIGDNQAHNVDSIRIKMCTGYTGTPISEPLPVSLETVRILAGSRCETIDTFINSELNVMTFKINNDNVTLTYVISGLMK